MVTVTLGNGRFTRIEFGGVNLDLEMIKTSNTIAGKT